MTPAEIAAILSDHDRWLRGVGGARANFRGADLRGAGLTRADLRYADLEDANLEDANLEDANLEDATLEDATLTRAILRRATLRRATLRRASLTRADLRGTDLRGTDLRDADLGGTDLRDADLREADLRGAHLAGSCVEDADIRDADFRDADLGGANLAGSCVEDAYIEGAILGQTESLAAAAAYARRYRERHPDVPVVGRLDSRIHARISSSAGALDMGTWHTCETTHCRAGWAIHLAGEAGYALEARVGPERAGAMIYRASTGRVPWFFASNEGALRDIERRAAEESELELLIAREGGPR